jgi:hypothetical protein
MSDEEDTADPTRSSSRRDRFKGAVARTKTKLTKRNKETATDVDDFLATGRASTSTARPSTSDSFPGVPEPIDTSHSRYKDGHEPPHPADGIPPPQPSPRRIVVPKIDVSSSQRYPAAQPLEQQNNEHSKSSLLRPEYQGGRSRSSSFAKGRGRARGLSVQFFNGPPVVIGEGGDEAEAPTIEVGRAKARARSASPQQNGSPNKGLGRLWNKSPLQHIPRAGTSSPKQIPSNAQRAPQPPSSMLPGVRNPEPVPSPGLRRFQTGMVDSAPSPMSESRQATDKEFEMSMGMSPATTNSSAPSLVSPTDSATIHAPRPIRPIPVPEVKEMPTLHELKRENGTVSLRNKFHAGEGNALRSARRGESPVSPLDESDEHASPPPGPPLARNAQNTSISPPSYTDSGSGWQPPPPKGQFYAAQPPRRVPSEEYRPPSGPPPGRRLVDELPAPPSGPSSVRRPVEPEHPPPPGPPPARRPVNIAGSPPHRLPPGPPGLHNHHAPLPPIPSPQRRPDDEYMGWVPEEVGPTHMPSFPGVDDSGKLTPVVGEEHTEDSKRSRLKKRLFKKGS